MVLLASGVSFTPLASHWNVSWLTNSSNEMASFFRPVIANIIQSIRENISDATQGLVIPGGFGRSRYLLNHIRQAFPTLQVESIAPQVVGGREPVALGAQLRYDEITPRGLDSEQSFGIAQIEPYDQNVHQDCIANPNRIQGSQFHGGQVVYERWLPIFGRVS